MIYVEAPDNEITWPFVFTAGGITGTWDWQAELASRLDHLDLIMVNPRRANFPMGDEEEGKKQIEWEYKMLAKADLISFWFPNETLCPITLFELGKWLHTEPVVGCETGYERTFDVKVQTQLELGKEFEIAKSIDQLAFYIERSLRRKGYDL